MHSFLHYRANAPQAQQVPGKSIANGRTQLPVEARAFGASETLKDTASDQLKLFD
jgi:hypothetical protein